MSQSSLAAARKRRAPTTTTNNVNPGMPQASSSVPTINNQRGVPIQSGVAASQMNANQGLTLPQVITLVDQRLCALETHVRQSIQKERELEESQSAEENAIPNNITEVLDEFHERFETLAEELANLKNVVLNLQSYTMDVNKTLLQERIRILGDDISPKIDVENDSSSSGQSLGANV